MGASDDGGGGPRVEKYKRYVIMGLRDGRLVRIIARRGHTPDDIIRQALYNTGPRVFLSDVDNMRRGFDRLYLMTVGDEGVYGQCTNLNIQEIVSPAPVPSFALVNVEVVF